MQLKSLRIWAKIMTINLHRAIKASEHKICMHVVKNVNHTVILHFEWCYKNMQRNDVPRYIMIFLIKLKRVVLYIQWIIEILPIIFLISGFCVKLTDFIAHGNSFQGHSLYNKQCHCKIVYVFVCVYVRCQGPNCCRLKHQTKYSISFLPSVLLSFWAYISHVSST